MQCDCPEADYRWSASPDQEKELRCEGYVYAGETGRYPSRLMRRCSCTEAEVEILRHLGRACQSHGCKVEGEE